MGADVSARGNLNKFTDRAQISDWAAEAVQWAVGEGILGGRPNGTLDPKGLATRAEVAAMFMRFDKKLG
ncbi:MAG: S-layer homology domain-containing protein, partial [Faecousia sp.]